MAQKIGCITKERKKAILSRLNRIKGQVNGMQRMLEDDRYCLEILQQLSSTHEALRGVSKVLMKNYLEVCVTKAIQSKRKERQDKIYSELMDVVYKFAK
ncbi:MAG: metal-sensitive transcriptional regulator [Omnitrophica bacterium]|nr:metal-sensitive transcriptional regulator [Candidatus Omnitrophota bacterium]